MISVRKLHLLSVPAIVSASLFTGTAVALADSPDDTYIAKLHSLGVTWPAGEDSDAISLGHAICSDRAAGKTPDQLATEVHTMLSPKGFTYSDGTAIVSAAESAYCP
jgi:Protein of unknown function (DUF732)